MNKKFYSPFLILLLLISLVTMPMSTIVYAENESDEAGDDVTVGELEETEENEPIDELVGTVENEPVGEPEGTEENETNQEDAEEVDPEVDHPEISDERNVAEDEANEVTDDEQSKAEIVEFEDDDLREAVKEELGIESADVTVSDMEELEILYIAGGRTITSLNGLEHAVNLTELQVSYTGLEDISALANLKKLKNLYLSETKISDVSPLKDLTQLQSLNLASTNVTDVSPLKDLTQLTVLNISSTNVTDISALENLTNLELLDLDFTNVSDISVLKNLNKLTGLGLGAPNVTDISVLEHLQELNEVALYDTKITDIKVLRKLPKLMNAVLDAIDVEAYDFETLSLLIENGAIIGWDAYQWYISQLEDLFPEDKGFRVNEEKTQVTAYVKEDSYTLSADQVESLKKGNLSIVLEKEDVTTSIPSSVFKNYGAVEITIEEVDKVANSYSNVYTFTITQGTETISEFEEPITLTFKVNTEGANNVDHLQVFYLNETTGKWENIGGKYNAEAGTVTATTDHFSTFAVFEADEIDSNTIVGKVHKPSTEVEETDDGTEATDESTKVTIDDSTPTKINDNHASTGGDVGAVLPNTATNMYNSLFIGLALLLAGVSIFAIRRFSGKNA